MLSRISFTAVAAAAALTVAGTAWGVNARAATGSTCALFAHGHDAAVTFSGRGIGTATCARTARAWTAHRISDFAEWWTLRPQLPDWRSEPIMCRVRTRSGALVVVRDDGFQWIGDDVCRALIAAGGVDS
jgi:hypothetical protein